MAPSAQARTVSPSPSATGTPETLKAAAVSVIVPAYREAENLPELIERLERVRGASGLDLELLIINDESGDRTAAAVERAARGWVRLATRSTERGLSSAVVLGLGLATHPFIVVMDADLSHPPEDIPRLLRALETGADFALGSRYIPGGSTDDRWTLLRAINSRVATLLARPLTSVRDPMSGFFALRRSSLERAAPLNPVGYKIGLELIVKCRSRRIVEVPIHFASRTRGDSKLGLAEQLRYLRHLARLLLFKLRHGRA
jgi:dolichol-phosphate mannosyltransferase